MNNMDIYKYMDEIIIYLHTTNKNNAMKNKNGSITGIISTAFRISRSVIFGDI
jgi:hypothetical protein